MKKAIASMTDKPYNRCLGCEFKGIKCDGPRTSAMPLLRWCEYMRDMKDVAGLSNQEIADKSGVSLKTVERIMAMKVEQDIYRETARAIENVVIGSSNQFPCYMAFVEEAPDSSNELLQASLELERVMADNADYRKALDDIHASYQAEMNEIRGEAQRKIAYLLKQVERLRETVDYLQDENRRKSKIVDKYVESR
mgnify:CR=1 FL=1